MNTLFNYFVLLATMLLCCCTPGKQKSKGRPNNEMQYATLLCMNDSNGTTIVTVKDPWHSGNTLQQLRLSVDAKAGKDNAVLHPLRRVVVFTTAHCQLLEYLHLQDRIVGVCDLRYMLIADIQRRVKNGTIADCGSSMAPDMEKIAALHPDAIIASPYEGNTALDRLQRLGIPVIQAADYMEATALGRAEWMRYYGRLFGKGQDADALFHQVDSSYNSLRNLAAKMPKGKSIITERMTGNVWYMPGGESTVAAIIRDANGLYPFAADKHSGSLPLSFEQVIGRAAGSEVWAIKFNGDAPLTKAQLLQECSGYKALKAFQTGSIYECNCSATPYFEEVSWRPDLLLREFILLLHPHAGLGSLRYYQRLGEPGSMPR